MARLQLTTANPKVQIRLRFQDYDLADKKWARKPGTVFETEVLPFVRTDRFKSTVVQCVQVSLQNKVRRIVLDCTEKGKGSTVTIQNTDIRNTIRVLPIIGKKEESPVAGYVQPGNTLDTWVGNGTRVILEEVPT